MPDLDFRIESVAPVPYAAAPTLSFKLRVTSTNREEIIHSMVLRAQIHIEVTRRHYTAEEQARLSDLFGEPARWGQTLKTMLWTHVALNVPGFQGETTVEIPVPCTFDFNVASTKYFHGLSEGDLPLNFLFSGTVFYRGEQDELQVAPISWEKEAKFRLPLKVWKQMIDEYYPNTAWLCLRRDAFERLYEYKVRNGIPTWEEVIERIFQNADEPVRS
ncbi:MAG TPA: DUF6084 family protein [Candidatus Acidoferrales bacterium]|nr:DUF6084 family protein [Candidatus Acidoferrales bacterium]